MAESSSTSSENCVHPELLLFTRLCVTNRLYELPRRFCFLFRLLVIPEQTPATYQYT